MGIETTFTNISLLSILEAGLRHSINPASLLGWTLFFVLIIRMQIVYRHGILFGFCLLSSFIFQQQFIHLGVLDILLFYIPKIRLFVNLLWIAAAILLGLIGAVIFRKTFERSDDVPDFLKQLIYSGLPKTKKQGLLSFLLVVVKGVFWGIFFALFCGLWPFNDTVIMFFYEGLMSLEKDFPSKFLLLEAAMVVPFLLLLIAMPVIFKRFAEKKMAPSKISLFVLSGFLFGTGLGTLFYFIKEMI